MKRTINSNDIDKEIALSVSSSMLESLDGLPIEHSLSCLNGIVVGMCRFVEEIKKNTELSDEDCLEKLILSWLSATDPVTGLKFSKFISTECIDIDLSAL